jgi:beta-glucosidase
VETSNEPLYPFGYGLSYTRFAYQNLRVTPEQVRAGETVTIQVDVRNVGGREGDEVVQLYTRTDGATVTRPVRELRGFKRLTLQPGEMKTVRFEVNADQLAYYNCELAHVLEPATVRVMVGSSSRDIHLQSEVTIVGETTRVTEKTFFCFADVE